MVLPAAAACIHVDQLPGRPDACLGMAFRSCTIVSRNRRRTQQLCRSSADEDLQDASQAATPPHVEQHQQMMTSAPAAPLQPWHSSTAGRLGLLAILALAALLVWQRVTGSRSYASGTRLLTPDSHPGTERELDSTVRALTSPHEAAGGRRLASTGHLSFRPNRVGQLAFWRDAASSAALLTAEGLAMPTGSTAELLGLQLQYLQFLRSSETIEALKAKPPPMPKPPARV